MTQTVKLSDNILKLITRFTWDDLIVKLFWGWIPCKTASWGWRQLRVYLSTGRGWQSSYFIGVFWLHLKIIGLNFKKICSLVFMFVLFFLCLLLFLAFLKNIDFTCFMRNSLNAFKPVNKSLASSTDWEKQRWEADEPSLFGKKQWKRGGASLPSSPCLYPSSSPASLCCSSSWVLV